jgi:hypothetical protein
MIRRDPRSKLEVRPRTRALGATVTHPFLAPSLTYRSLSVPPGAFAASRSTRNKRAPPLERAREQLRVSVWENEGGTAVPAVVRRKRGNA